MQIRLSRAKVPRIDARNGALFVNARDLLGEERRASGVIVYAGWTHENGFDVAAFFPDHLFGSYLRLPVRQAGVQRRGLVNRTAALCRRVYEHRAGKYELVDVERPQAFQEVARALHRDLVILRIGLSTQVEIGGKVDHRGNVIAVSGSNPPHGGLDTALVPDIEANALGFCRRVRRGVSVESDDLVVRRQRLHYSRADKTTRAGNDCDWLIVRLCQCGALSQQTPNSHSNEPQVVRFRDDDDLFTVFERD